MATSVLVVDDVEFWRCFASDALRSDPEFQIVSEAADGIAAVQQAEELQPDLVVLDIGLPGLNGIDAAIKIRSILPRTRILFLTVHCSSDLMETALLSGGDGFVVKSDAARELLRAARTVLQAKRFLSTRLRSLQTIGA